MKRQILATVLLAASLCFGMLCSSSFAQEKAAAKAKVLCFTRSQGFEHGPAKLQADGTTICGQALKKYCDAKNIELVETQDGKLFDGDLDQYAAFVFYTSGNLTGKITDEKRPKSDKEFPLSNDGVNKLIAAVKAGKGLVGIHSATDTHCGQKGENGIDIYTSLIGARFASHGPQQVATVSIVKPVQLPWLKDKGDKYTAHEEWYAMRECNKDMHVLLVQKTEGMKGDCYNRPDYPSTWIRTEGKGRVAYTAFGHDNKFWIKDGVVQDANIQPVGELIEWSLGRFDMDTTSNFDSVTPKGNELPPPAPKK